MPDPKIEGLLSNSELSASQLRRVSVQHGRFGEDDFLKRADVGTFCIENGLMRQQPQQQNPQQAQSGHVRSL